MPESDKKHLLVVEDDEGLQSQLRWAFEGYEVTIAGDREEGIAALRRVQPGVVLLDLGLPPDPGGVTEGLATLTKILQLLPETKVIVITGDNERANAVTAIRNGAYDYYQKPVEHDVLGLIVDRAYHVYELELENRRLQTRQKSSPLTGIIANSPKMLDACRMVERVAPTEITVLLLGASGTGKELFARAIHELSGRAGKTLVAINCGAIPANLIESELFGYEKGAFTGAVKQTIGQIEMAEGGTLFLDEIGDLSYDLQVKLLRFLQEREITRVGGRTPIPVDTRIICATHQNLEDMIAQGTFREDLFYRISDVSIKIPPLRHRESDVMVLATTFLDKYSREFQCPRRSFSPDAIHALESHTWPGNVRELESKIKRAIIMAENGHITARDLELTDADDVPLPLNLRQVRDTAERREVERAMANCDGNVSDAANTLGIARPTLYKLMKKYGLKG